MKYPILVLSLLLLLQMSAACNEAVCASIVSKCTLLKSCECTIEEGKPCTCCDRCKKCLDYLLTECCSCFELCPERNVTEATQDSTVFDFKSPEPELWDALIEDSNLDAWERYSFPVDVHPSMVKGVAAAAVATAAKKTVSSPSVNLLDQTEAVLSVDDLVTVNCTVVFLNQCVSANKCKASCSTMGATSGRWFEDGCCECIGHHCLSYGINESRCPACSEDDDELDLENLSDAELDQIYVSYDTEEGELLEEEDLYQEGGGGGKAKSHNE
jgi:hypothetical protein